MTFPPKYYPSGNKIPERIRKGLKLRYKAVKKNIRLKTVPKKVLDKLRKDKSFVKKQNILRKRIGLKPLKMRN